MGMWGYHTRANVHPRPVYRFSCSSVSALRVPSAWLQLPSASQSLWAPCCQQISQSPALSQPNPTAFLCSGQTDGVPTSAPVEMGPAALHASAPCCWEHAGMIPRAGLPG